MRGIAPVLGNANTCVVVHPTHLRASLQMSQGVSTAGHPTISNQPQRLFQHFQVTTIRRNISALQHHTLQYFVMVYS